MNRAPGRALAAVVPLLLAPAVLAQAQPAPTDAAASWHVYGSNTARVEHYDNGGDPGAAFFPFEGYHAYDELSLGFARRASPWESVQGYVLGLGNASDYRSTERGLVLERGSVTWEKGDTALPFRATAGDYFGFLSLRTLQRPLKGLHLELQPAPTGRARQSLLLMVGTDKPEYRDFDPTDNLYTAGSWLLQAPGGMRLGVNAVHNLRDASGTRARRAQSVYSIAGEQPFAALGQRLNLEAELAWLSGDVEDAAGVRGERTGAGYFAQLRGDNRGPLFYRFRFEHYGRDYLPNGAAIVADRRALEAHAGWRFTSGLQLRGRLQRFRDGYESANPLDTTTAGVSLGGALARGVTSAVDGFVQSRESRDGGVNGLTRSLSVNLSAALAPAWTGRVGAFFQSSDEAGSDNDRITRQITLGVDHRFRLAGFQGLVGPGVVARTVRGAAAGSDAYGPTLALELNRARHAMRLDYSALRQDRERGDDVLEQRLGLRYAYTRIRHQVGFEIDVHGRDPDAAPGAHGHRASVFYTYSFDRPAAATPMSAAVGRLAAAAGPEAGIDLVALAPGLDLEAARERVRVQGLGEGVQTPSRVVYESRLLESVDQRQRLVLDASGGRLTRSALLIEFDDVGDGQGAARTYERVRAQLIQRYGRPDQSYERGDLGADLAAGVNDGRIARVDEWRTPGGRLRFGIPRRLDGQVRMELQHARRFGNPRDASWSVDAVR